eukprot:2210396-Alexandrium_andersonii.AAC.1
MAKNLLWVAPAGAGQGICVRPWRFGLALAAPVVGWEVLASLPARAPARATATPTTKFLDPPGR